MENWNEKVKKVCVILSSSRSGSSVFKKVLQAHPDVASLDGELEPILILTRNGFPFNSDSDELGVLDNKPQILNLMREYLRIPNINICSNDEIVNRWANRLKLQFADLDIVKITRAIAAIVESHDFNSFKSEGDINNQILDNIFKYETWRKSYYDGFFDKKDFKPFDMEKIEEPPFVSPSLYSRNITQQDLREKVFLFKTPQDAYRPNLYKELFPNADITYIHLTRGYAQTVNGLIDGWISPVGFFSHDMSNAGVKLSIERYSEAYPFGEVWWKFDLPPNWKGFIRSALIDVCANQWIQAHRSILNNFQNCHQIKFEDFLMNPSETVRQAERMLFLKETGTDLLKLPLIMATEQPKELRWKIRAKEILPLYGREDIKSMMDSLGYGANQDLWI